MVSHYHCLASVMIVGEDHGPLMVRTVLDSGSHVTGISDRLLRGLEAQFPGERLVLPDTTRKSATMADGREVGALGRARELQVALQTRCGRVCIAVSCDVLL